MKAYKLEVTNDSGDTSESCNYYSSFDKAYYALQELYNRMRFDDSETQEEANAIIPLESRHLWRNKVMSNYYHTCTINYDYSESYITMSMITIE